MMSRFHSRIAGIPVLVAALLLLGAVGPAHAQSNGDGSAYSRFGLGMLSDFSSAQSAALGGGGYALRSLNYNPTGNPALWGDQVYTRLSAGASLQQLAVDADAGPSSQLTSGTIEALQFSFPLYERTLGVGLSFQPYSQQNHRIQRRDSLSIDVAPNQTASAPFDVIFRGTGGLQSIRGGLGYNVNDVLRVGASVDVIFGIVERRQSTEFSDAPLRNVEVIDGTRLVGATGTLGGHLSLADVFASDDALSIGAAVSLPTTLNGTRTLTLGKGRDLSTDTLTSQEGEVSLPWRSRLGVAYQPDERWSFTVDGLFEPWSTFSSTFERIPNSTAFPVGGSGTLTDRWRVSAGAEILPAGDERRSSFLASTAYRLGLYVEQLYVRPDKETDIRTYAVTGGVSLPTSLSGTRVDLNLNAGTRGTTSGSLVRDNFYGVALHINFGERWFQRRKLR